MLVMRRRAGEILLIGPDVELEILEIGPTRVKLGITAPASCSIVRKEAALTRQENLTASQTPPPQAVTWLSAKLSMRKPL